MFGVTPPTAPPRSPPTTSHRSRQHSLSPPGQSWGLPPVLANGRNDEGACAEGRPVWRRRSSGRRHAVALDQSACSGWGDRDSANPGPRRERAELRGGTPPRPFEAGEIKIARSMQCVVPLAFCSGFGVVSAFVPVWSWQGGRAWWRAELGVVVVLVAHEFRRVSMHGGTPLASLRPADFGRLDRPDHTRGSSSAPDFSGPAI